MWQKIFYLFWILDHCFLNADDDTKKEEEHKRGKKVVEYLFLNHLHSTFKNRVYQTLDNSGKSPQGRQQQEDETKYKQKERIKIPIIEWSVIGYWSQKRQIRRVNRMTQSYTVYYLALFLCLLVFIGAISFTMFCQSLAKTSATAVGQQGLSVKMHWKRCVWHRHKMANISVELL